MEKRTLPVIGMACSSCAASVERRLQGIDGVASASVSLATRTAVVEWDPEKTSPEAMKSELNKIGFDLLTGHQQSAEEVERREYSSLKRKTLLSWALALACMYCSMKGGMMQETLIIALLNLWFCGRSFYTSAVGQLRHGITSMDTLVSLSTAVSFVYSAVLTFMPASEVSLHPTFDASVMIITFVLTGRLLEERVKRSTASSIRRLVGLRPKTARLVQEERLEQVPIGTVVAGDVLEVRAGEKVPVDGMVTWAASFMKEDGAYVDESMLTGEPIPVLKQRSSKVMAGTMVQQGTLRFRASQVGEQTALAQIIRMVGQAQGSKAPVQRIVDRMAMVFVPVVIALSVLTFLVWMAVGGTAVLPQAVVSSVAVLVIACPCAMGLATPMALMVGVGKAADRGILVKDAAAIETLRKVNALVTDKTGTLTIPNDQVDFTKASDLEYEEREALKPHVHEAVEALSAADIDVYMMSGDSDEAVSYWAKQAGIANWQGKVTAQDKEDLVRKLQAEGRVVAMVGDGINDSQALACADVSIAMGQGTDVAMDVAQVTLLTTDLRALPEAVALSKRTVSMIRQNLFWAFVYNLVCIPLAAGLPRAFGIDFQITPMWASGLMALSSISVVLNSLRLKRR
ncbi:MAG: heavy metal translocating P-type ATPase [Prevotella sp.]|nr:heavy metal translocating P-type ATPase [Prevotella sp.]